MVTTRRQKRQEAMPEPAGSPPPKPQRQKRKGIAEAARPPPSKRPRHDGSARCAFLELPRELRDEIYKHVMGSESSITMRRRNFITKSGLVGANNQICEEFLDAVLFYAPSIDTTVRNHNFAHVVTFLNRLSEAQLTRFKSDSTAKTPVRTIRITLTYSSTKQSTRSQLNRWLDRFDDPNRRGAEIEFEYVLDRPSWRNGGYKQRPKGRATAGPRSSKEESKICRALQGLRKSCWGF